jgi:hypothetical protein
MQRVLLPVYHAAIRVLTLVALGVSPSLSVAADDAIPSAFAACLKKPSRACLFAEALRVANSEAMQDRRAGYLANIAQSMAKANRVDSARDTFENAHQIVSTVKDESTRAAVLTDLGEAESDSGFRKETAETISEARAIIQGLPDVKSRVKGLVDIAKAQVSTGLNKDAAETIRAALDSVHELGSGDIPGYLLKSLAELQATVGDIGGAVSTAQMSGTWADEAMGKIAHAQAQSGDRAGAIKTAQAISNSRSRGDAFASIVVVETESGHVAEALDLAKTLAPNDGNQIIAFAGIAAAQAKLHDTEQTAATLAVAHQAVRQTDKAYDRATALAAIGLTEQTAGLTSAAQATLADGIANAQMIADPGVRSTSLAEVASHQAKAGFENDARKTYEIAVEAALLGTKTDSKLRHLEWFSNEEAHAGLFREAAATLSRAAEVARTEIKDDGARADAAKDLAGNEFFVIGGNIEIGNVEDELNLVGTFEDPGVKDFGYSEVAERLAKDGAFDAAFKTAQLISSDSIRGLAWAKIAVFQPE